MTPALFLVAVVGCGAGSTLRYAISRLDHKGVFPWPTMVSNITGSALMGVVAAAVIEGDASMGGLAALGIGVAGGLSTFSTLAVDAVILWREGRPRAMMTYLAASLVTGLLAAGLGWGIGSAFA